ncbi:MAG TPA: helix-turn-helix domain-containing protein [Thermoanaerobaculia bacterium]|nr:helix-turn-helix domain-containing protein [Thermoanaerobaculia bacterium]
MERKSSPQDRASSILARELGSRIAHFREMLGWRQNGLAEQAGLRPQRLSNIERGVQLPRVDELVILARTLGVSLDELVFGTPRRTPLTTLAAQLEALMPEAELAALTRHLEVLATGYAARQAASQQSRKE